MRAEGFEVVAIGGSAGSLPVVEKLLASLPSSFPFTVIIVLHRLKNVISGMDKLLAMSVKGPDLREPDDKEAILPYTIYLAPQNYHLLIENDKTFSLEYSELIHYSRPSIDATFECLAEVYADRTLAILLSGANADGAAGLLAITANGGVGWVQDPETAEYPVMPQAALNLNTRAVKLTPEQMYDYLKALNGQSS